MNKNINRRSFLKRFSAGVATATLATSCSSSVNNDEEPKVVVKKERVILPSHPAFPGVPEE